MSENTYKIGQCCEVLLKMDLGWMKNEDGTRLIPYIKGNSDTYRVNHCPSCGKYIRDIEINTIKERDRVVWDSGSGYEIGYLKDILNNIVDIVTGSIQGPSCIPKSEIFIYNDDLITELTTKYGYEKRFSENF